jgi:hypothetical protein
LKAMNTSGDAALGPWLGPWWCEAQAPSRDAASTPIRASLLIIGGS